MAYLFFFIVFLVLPLGIVTVAGFIDPFIWHNLSDPVAWLGVAVILGCLFGIYYKSGFFDSNSPGTAP